MIVSSSRRKVVARRTAFTLLEVLVVVAILIVLAGTAVIYIPQYLEDSRIQRAQLDCQAWEGAVNKYYLNNPSNGYPGSLNDVKNLIEDGGSKLNDPWNHPYQLSIITNSDGQEVPQVFSNGPKGVKVTKKGLGVN